jgi:Sulfotransferase domain
VLYLKKIKEGLNGQLNRILSLHSNFYVISHERSGTHFLINTIFQNAFITPKWYNIGEWFGPYENFSNRFEHIDKFNNVWQQSASVRGIVKSHCDRDLFQARYKKAKVIYIVRDPRDTLVSLYYYLNRPEFYQYNPLVPDHRSKSFSEFLRRPISPFLRYSYSLNGNFANIAERWSSHVYGWCNAPDTLVVHYEDLHRDYAYVLAIASQFIGLRLKGRTKSVGLLDVPSILPRKGIIGDWKNVLSVDDEEFLRIAVERAGNDWTLLTRSN